MLKYLQNRCLRPKYRFYTSFYRKFDFFFDFFFVPGIILDHSIHIFWFFLIKKIKNAPWSAGWTKRVFDFFFPQFYTLKKKIKIKKKKKTGISIKTRGFLLKSPSLLSAMAGPIGKIIFF